MPSVFLTEAAFSPAECEEIVRSVDNRGFDNCCPPGACPYSDLTKCGYGLRDSVRLMPEDHPLMFETFYRIGKHYNDKYYGFDIEGYPEGVPEIYINRYSYYDHAVAALRGHADWGPIQPSKRKITLSVPLSPASAYDGGVLSCYESPNPIIGTTQQGAATVFPAWTIHEVGPLVSGVRYSAVGWITGAESFR